MKLIKLELINYRQFESRVIEFTLGLVGLIGPNASGKSHLLEALQLSLAGDIPGSNKSDLLRWGATTGSVTLTFDVAGITYRVSRELTTSTAVLETVGTTIKIHGITKVNTALSKLLGVDKDIFRQAVFARQAEIDDILFTEPRTRALTLQKLCGIGEAAKIHDGLKKVVAINEVTYSFEEELADAEERKVVAQVEQEKLDEQLKSIPADSTNATEISEEIANTVAQVDLIKRKEYLEKQIATDVQARDTIVQTLQSKLDLIADLPDMDLDREIAEYKKLQVEAEVKEQNIAIVAAMNKKIAELGDIKVFTTELADLERNYREVNDKILKNRTIITPQLALQKALSAVNDGLTKCPLCHSNIRNIAELRESVDIIIANLVAEYSHLTSQLTGYKQRITVLENKIKQYEHDHITYTTKNAAATDIINRSPADLLDSKTYAKELEDLISIQKNMLSLKQAIAVEQESSKNIEQVINRETQEYNDVSNKIYINKTIYEVEGVVKALREVLNKHMEHTTKKANLTGQLSRVNLLISNLGSTIEKIKEKQDNIQNHVKALTVLHNVIDWFHYTKGPSQVASKYLQVLVQDINKFLETFSAPFVVVPDYHNLGFRVSFTDGRDMPEELPIANELSGGEKIILAVAFRLANYQLFADKLGLLSLDEPTVYLDADNISNFCIVIEQLKTIVKNLNLQIIVATHEVSVMPYFDTVISLNN